MHNKKALGESVLLGLRYTLTLIGILFSISSCITYYRGGAGGVEEISIPGGRLYCRVSQLTGENYIVLPKLTLNCDIPSTFVQDTSKWYWSVCLYHTEKTGNPGSQFIADSIRIEFDEKKKSEELFDPLCSETFDEGWNRVFCIQPIPLPKEFVGTFSILLNLSLVDKTGDVIIDRRPVTLSVGISKHKESEILPGK